MTRLLFSAVLLAILATLATPPTASAAENAYDVVGKSITPWIDLLLVEPQRKARALLLEVSLGESTDTPAALADAKVKIFLQIPDKLRIEGTVGGEKLIVCRRGQEIWAWPGSKVEALLAQAGKLPPPVANTRLRNFQVPITSQQATFLPTMLTVQDGGFDNFRNARCRKLNVQVIPEVAQHIDFADWTALMWIGASDYKIRKVKLSSPHWRGTVLLDQVRFLPYFKPEAWAPGPLANDVTKLSPARFSQLTQALFKK